MYRLTTRRLQKAKDVLEKYRTLLRAKLAFDAGQLEHELRQCWDLGYQELKDIMADMLRHERYRHVAIYYMEHSNCTGVVSEFQSPLAKVYGIRGYFDPDRQKKQQEFWAAFQKGLNQSDL